MKKFDPHKPVQTRDGRPARILCTDADLPTGQTIVALTGEEDAHGEFESVYTFSENGRYGRGDSDLDLINIPEAKEFYINVYDGLQYVFDTREDADEFDENFTPSTSRTACIHVTYEDGEGL